MCVCVSEPGTEMRGRIINESSLFKRQYYNSSVDAGQTKALEYEAQPVMMQVHNHLSLLDDVRELSDPDDAVLRSDQQETVAAVQR